MPPWPVLAGGALAGLCLGSFAVTAGLRWSRAETVGRGRSRCDACAVPLGFAQTAPVVSYMRLRGACATCGARIDPIHLAGELSGAAVALSLAAFVEPPRALLLAGLGFVLIAAATVDLKVRRLPDPLTLAVAAIALALAAWRGLGALLAGLVAAVACTLVLLALRAVGERARGEAGLGLGDVKLAAGLAVWLGAATPHMIAVAALAGLVAAPWLRNAERRLAFGPFLALGGWGVGIAIEAAGQPWGAWP